MEKSLLETMKRLSSKNISDDLIKWNHLNEEDILCIEMIVHNEEYRKYLERLTSSKSSNIEKKPLSEMMEQLLFEDARNDSMKRVAEQSKSISYYQCKNKNCGSWVGKTYTQQLRSADEGETTVHECDECGTVSFIG